MLVILHGVAGKIDGSVSESLAPASTSAHPPSAKSSYSTNVHQANRSCTPRSRLCLSSPVAAAGTASTGKMTTSLSPFRTWEKGSGAGGERVIVCYGGSRNRNSGSFSMAIGHQGGVRCRMGRPRRLRPDALGRGRRGLQLGRGGNWLHLVGWLPSWRW
jgi:hypothetical protein